MVEEAPQRGGSGLEGGSPGMTCPQHHRTRWGQMRGRGGRWWRKPVGASRVHWLLSACAPLCVPGVAPVVVVPVVWRPLALVLIVLVPLLSILGRKQKYRVGPHLDLHFVPPLTPLSPGGEMGAVTTADTWVP